MHVARSQAWNSRKLSEWLPWGGYCFPPTQSKCIFIHAAPFWFSTELLHRVSRLSIRQALFQGHAPSITLLFRSMFTCLTEGGRSQQQNTGGRRHLITQSETGYIDWLGVSSSTPLHLQILTWLGLNCSTYFLKLPKMPWNKPKEMEMAVTPEAVRCW